MIKYTNILISIIICTMFTSFMYFLNNIYINIRMKELKVHLQKANQNENNIDHINLVMKYTLHRKLYEDKISIREANIIQSHVNSLTKDQPKYDNVKITGFQIAYIPALYFINFYRFFMGKPPIKDISGDTVNSHFELAYYFERNNLYRRALKHYKLTRSESYNISRPIKASILLHEGYCYALLGEYKKAKKKYKLIINNYSNENIAITATILLKYLEGFQSESKKIMKDKTISLNKSVKLFNLLSYNEALRILSKVEQKSSKPQLEKIQYYKARCYYETGESQKSLELLLNLIIKNPTSKYSKLANKTIFIIGSQIEGHNKIKETAIKLNKIIKDDDLNQMIINSASSFSNSNEMNKNKIDLKIKPEILEKINSLEVYNKDYKYIGENVTIRVKDGNMFYGVVKDKDKDNIFLLTSVGKITINKKKIAKIKTAKYNKNFDYIGRKVKIKVNDGNLFYGVVKDKDKDKILLLTSFGEITINKKKIIKIKILQ